MEEKEEKAQPSQPQTISKMTLSRQVLGPLNPHFIVSFLFTINFTISKGYIDHTSDMIFFPRKDNSLEAFTICNYICTVKRVRMSIVAQYNNLL